MFQFLYVSMGTFDTGDELFREFKQAEEGERVVADVELGDTRGVSVFEFEGMSSGQFGLADPKTGETQASGTFFADDDSPAAELTVKGRRRGDDVAKSMGVGARDDCDPAKIGRHSPSGEFREPDKVGEPDVAPVTDVCRDPMSGKFEDFFDE